MHKSTLNISVAATALMFATPVLAAPIEFENEFIKSAISDDGTLGINGTVSPGLLYDGSGAGNFPPSLDYLTPGSPYEGFQVNYSSATGGRTAVANNNSDGGDDSDDISQISLTDLSAGGNTSISWVGQDAAGNVQVQHDYVLDMGDQQLRIQTTVTALNDINDVTFARAIDNDVDSGSGGGSTTNDIRGLDLPGTDDDIDEDDIVLSTGPLTGQAVGLFTTEDLTHATYISGFSGWTSDPDTILAGNGTTSYTGDATIGIAFSLGDLAASESISFDYAYIFGTDLASVDVDDPSAPPPTPAPPPPTGIPEPASMALLGAGLAGLGLARRRKIKL